MGKLDNSAAHLAYSKYDNSEVLSGVFNIRSVKPRKTLIFQEDRRLIWNTEKIYSYTNLQAVYILER